MLTTTVAVHNKHTYANRSVEIKIIFGIYRLINIHVKRAVNVLVVDKMTN